MLFDGEDATRLEALKSSRGWRPPCRRRPAMEHARGQHEVELVSRQRRGLGAPVHQVDLAVHGGVARTSRRNPRGPCARLRTTPDRRGPRRWRRTRPCSLARTARGFRSTSRRPAATSRIVMLGFRPQNASASTGWRYGVARLGFGLRHSPATACFDGLQALLVSGGEADVLASGKRSERQASGDSS